jgi:hypothetical protein
VVEPLLSVIRLPAPSYLKAHIEVALCVSEASRLLLVA